MAIVCPNCTSELEESNQTCKQCKANEIATQSPSTPNAWNGFSAETAPLGIGGWLSLVALGLIVSPLTLFHSLWTDIHALLGPNAKLAAKIIPDLPFLVVYEVLINLALLTGWAYLIALSYRKRSVFPKYYCAWLVLAFIAIAAEYTFCLHLASGSPALEAAKRIVDHMGNKLAVSAGKRFLVGAVWITYFSMSRRVKATFVN